MHEIDLQGRVEAYLEAFEARDLSRCVDFFDNDACIHFLSDDYRGKQAIEKWHRERFAVNLRIVSLKKVTVKGNKARISARVASERIKAWPASSLSGIVTLSFEQENIKEVKFGLGALWSP